MRTSTWFGNIAAGVLVSVLCLSCSSESTSEPTPTPGEDAAAEAANGQDAAVEATTQEEAAAEAAVEAATVDAPVEAAIDAANVTKCKNEVDLSTQPLPCDCYGTIIEDPKTAMPSCTKKVLCCPATKGPKCE